MPTHLIPRGVALMLWGLAAASAVYWGMRLGQPPSVASPSSTPVVRNEGGAAHQTVLSQFLGTVPLMAAEPQAERSQRFVLTGVVASAGGKGAALIAVDGKPARPFAVGAQIAAGYVLQSVSQRGAVLAAGADSPAAVVLAMPVFRAANTASSPLAGASTAAPPASPATPTTPAPAATAAAITQSTPPPGAEAVTRTEPPPRTDSRRERPSPATRSKPAAF